MWGGFCWGWGGGMGVEFAKIFIIIVLFLWWGIVICSGMGWRCGLSGWKWGG